MTTTTKLTHLELHDNGNDDPVQGTAVIEVRADVDPAAAAAGAGRAERRTRVEVSRAALDAFAGELKRLDSDAALDALPEVIARKP